MSYDVFVCYNSKDRATVRTLVRKLKLHRISVWYDEDQLRPAVPTMRRIEQGLDQSRTVAVMIGNEGFGPHHQAEQDIAVQMAIEEQGRQVMAVILPATADHVVKHLPRFLRRVGYVRFQRSIDDPDAWERLIWGITGEKAPLKPRTAPTGGSATRAPGSHEELNQAADKVAKAVRRSASLTFVLGARSSFGGPSLPACFSEVSRGLLMDLKLIEDQSTQHQFLPPIDTVASIYSVKMGLDDLEERLACLLASDRCACSTLHGKLATLIGSIQSSRLLTRKIRYAPEPQLIVSTSIDLACERALLMAGVSFTRIVQHRSGSKLTINAYRDIRLIDGTVRFKDEDGSETLVSLADAGALDDAIATTAKRTIEATVSHGGSSDDKPEVNPLRELSLAGLPDPYLYKYHGSQDVQGSCALATDHYLRLATRSFVPDKVFEIMNNSALVVLGCGLLDPDVRHLEEMLLRRAYQGNAEQRLPRYAIVRPPEDEPEDPYRRLEVGAWDNLSTAALQEMGIKLLAGESDAFLDLLADRLSLSSAEGT